MGRALEFVWLRSLSMVAWRPNGDCVGLCLTPSYCCLAFLCMSTPVWLFTVDTWTVSNVWALREKLPPPSVYNSLRETQPSFLSSYLECLAHPGTFCSARVLLPAHFKLWREDILFYWIKFFSWVLSTDATQVISNSFCHPYSCFEG